MAKVHIVKTGECLTSIAEDYGFFAPTLWDHPSNAALKEAREHMNVLAVGDRVSIPDVRKRVVPGAVDQSHRFVRRGVPARFRLQLLNVSEPRRGLAYTLVIDDSITLTGKTDGNGVLDVELPTDARRAVLTIDEDGSEIRIKLGQLAPVSEDEGVRQRLLSLGFLREPANESDFAAAVCFFQEVAKLDVTGEPDDATRDALREFHDTPATEV